MAFSRKENQRIAPLRFDLFAYWHDPRWNGFVGATVKIWDLAENLSRQGHQVTLYLPKFSGVKSTGRFTVKQVPMIDLPILRLISFNIFLLILLLGRKTPDVVYLRRTNIFVPVVYARLRGALFFFEVNDDPYHNPNADSENRLSVSRNRWSIRLDEWHMRQAERVFVISEDIRDRIMAVNPHIPPRRFVLMPSGANTRLFSPVPHDVARRSIGLVSQHRYVGFVGTLLAHQGVDVLIAAAPAVLSNHPDCRFIIIGEGPMKSRWQEMARQASLENVFLFSGQIPYHKLPAWINAMDVCVAPYLQNAGYRSPVKIFDYLACGRPVVASMIEGTTDIFGSVEAVRLVAPEDPQALAGAISDMLAPHAGCTRACKTSSQWIRENFDRSIMARRVSDCAEKILAAKRNRFPV